MDYSNMTNSDLARAARQYDVTNNEGGEGYNPYLEELDRRYSEMQKATIAAQKAEWTPEVTAERKERWNAAVKANMPAGKMNATQMQAFIDKIENIVGFNYTDMKSAIARNK